MKNLKFVESMLGTTYLVSNFVFALVNITPLLAKAYLLTSLSFIIVYLLCVISGNRKFHDFYVFCAVDGDSLIFMFFISSIKNN